MVGHLLSKAVKLKDRRLAIPQCDQFAADLVGARFGWLDGPLEPAQPGKVELTLNRLDGVDRSLVWLSR